MHQMLFFFAALSLSVNALAKEPLKFTEISPEAEQFQVLWKRLKGPEGDLVLVDFVTPSLSEKGEIFKATLENERRFGDGFSYLLQSVKIGLPSFSEDNLGDVRASSLVPLRKIVTEIEQEHEELKKRSGSDKHSYSLSCAANLGFNICIIKTERTFMTGEPRGLLRTSTTTIPLMLVRKDQSQKLDTEGIGAARIPSQISRAVSTEKSESVAAIQR